MRYLLHAAWLGQSFSGEPGKSPQEYNAAMNQCQSIAAQDGEIFHRVAAGRAWMRGRAWCDEIKSNVIRGTAPGVCCTDDLAAMAGL